MSQGPAISMFLDTRRAKENGNFPVKLRVFTSKPRKQKLYPTKFELTKDDFAEIWLTLKPSKKAHKEIRKELEAVQTKANKVADKITPFRFEQFEKILFRSTNDGTKLEYHFNKVIEVLTKAERVGTASSYDLAQKSLKEYQELKLKKKYSNLHLYDITKSWLQGYENYMINKKELTYTTVGIYLRSLRAIFNTAIEDNEIEKELYPFGAKKYNIPTSTSTKKQVFNKLQLKTLFESEPKTEQQARAKAFWFFTYSCNGMNTKDICLLKNRDISKEGTFEFYRAKTRLTKGKKTTITVHLNDFAKNVIKEYGTNSTNPDDYVFPILTKGQNPTEQRRKIQNFTRYIRQHLHKLCEANNLPKCSVMWARHSFATSIVRNGKTMEFAQESLGHASITTTQNYFAGFEDETKKEMAETLMNF